MATPLTEEEIGLRRQARRRLVGAVALVLVVALVLPLVLDDEPKPIDPMVAVNLSATAAIPPTPAITPVDPDEPPPAAAKVPAAPARAPSSPAATVVPEPKEAPVPEDAPPPLPVVAEPKPIEVQASEAVKLGPQAVKPKAGETKPAAENPPPREPVGAGGFVVQFGVFSSLANARQLRDRLVRQGIGATVDVSSGEGRQMARVRAGPYANRDEAERVRDRVQDMSTDAVILSSR